MVLVFRSMAEAQDFFKSMAKENVKFLCSEEGKGYDGHNFFSCGDGKLYEGSLQHIMQELQQAVDADKENKEAQEGLAFISSKLPGLQLRPAPPVHRDPEEDEDKKKSGFNPTPKPY